MSKSYEKFKISIQDATNLMNLYDDHKKDPIKAEVLKRAGLIMALTAWETYVEDRLKESFEVRLKPLLGCEIGNYIQKKFNEELKRFHNPTSDKTRSIFKEFLGIDDVTKGWKWSNYNSPKEVCAELDRLLKLRGEVVHNSKGVTSGQQAHVVSKETLSKCITFLEGLVGVFDSHLDE